MIPLQPSPIFLSQRSHSLSNDVEMLQTDVMRFFAILCLCLMAIFALVKALPIAPPADRPRIAEPADLKAEAKSLQKQIVMLKKKLADMQSQVRAAAAAEQSTSQASKAAENEQDIRTRLTEAQQELKTVSQSLIKTRGELKVRELKLTRILSDIDNKQRIRSELKSQIENETRNLTKIRTALDQTSEKLNQDLQHNQKPESKLSEATSPPQPAGTGFTLRFASDAALQKLIILGKVKFYALTGKKAWQLHLTASRSIYSPTKFPPEIYEMETSTVPIDYPRIFHLQVAAFGRGSVTWGVTLPAQMRSSINRLIKGRDGGDLVIMPDGEVILN
jgi:predicted  nucleic acid-binding Zn-ribbon protein